METVEDWLNDPQNRDSLLSCMLLRSQADKIRELEAEVKKLEALKTPVK